MNDTDLTMKARAIASCLTYNDDQHQASAKHMLREMAHRIDTANIRVHKKRDGILLINGIGHSRFMTWKERLCWRLFGVAPRSI